MILKLYFIYFICSFTFNLLKFLDNQRNGLEKLDYNISKKVFFFFMQKKFGLKKRKIKIKIKKKKKMKKKFLFFFHWELKRDRQIVTFSCCAIILTIV